MFTINICEVKHTDSGHALHIQPHTNILWKLINATYIMRVGIYDLRRHVISLYDRYIIKE